MSTFVSLSCGRPANDLLFRTKTQNINKVVNPPAKPLFREGNKASQWSFVLTSSFTNPENIKRLSNLHRKDVLYIVFVIDNDNYGNRYLEGFIKTTRRHRVSFIRKLVGPAIVDVVRDVPLTLANLHLKSEVHEFGDRSTARFSTYRNELALLKSEAGNFSMERMQTSFPSEIIPKVPADSNSLSPKLPTTIMRRCTSSNR